MNKIKKAIAFLLVGLFYAGLASTTTPASAADVNDRMTVRVGAYENEPKIFTNAGGQVVGIFPDILAQIATLEGWNIQYINGTWDECLGRLEKGELDLMVDVAYSDERAKKFNFCKETVFVNWGVVFVPETSQIESFKDLQAKRVAIMKGSILSTGKAGGIQSILIASDISCDFVEAKDYKGVFELVASGKADAGVANRTFGEVNAEKYRLKGTSMIFEPSQLRFAYTKRSEKAQKIADKIDHDLKLYKGLPNSVYYQTLKKYLTGTFKGETVEEMIPGSTAQFSLSQEDREWLKEHPVIRVVLNPNWAPIEFADDGEPYGITVDYLRRFEKKLGVQFEFIKESDRRQAINILKSGELDMSGAIAETPDRKEFLTFTAPYLPVPIVIFSRDDVTYVNDLDQLNGKSVAVLDGYATQELITKDHPKIHWVGFKSVEDALESLEQGEIFAFVNDIVTTSYYISKNGFTHIKVVGETPYKYHVAMAAQSGTPLASILDKTLASIPQSERDAIYQKWFSIKYEKGFNYTLMWKILAGVLLIIIFILYWNRRLAREITQRKKAQAELEKNKDYLEVLNNDLGVAKEQAESADRIKSAFLATMSHELRTPLNSIIGFTGILQQEMVGPLNEEQKKQLGMVRDSSRHLLNLINDVLDISKIEAGQLQITPESFDLRAEIEKAIQAAKPLAEKKNIALEVEITPDVGTIMSDQRRVEQILLNLLSNAIKFSDKGKVRIECSLKENQVLIRVIDSGIGIKNEDMDKLFKPFRQVDSGLTRQYEGTGLGLSICKKLVDLLGGTIGVKSEWGKGSTFTFTLPAERKMV
jgi:polar amino acid transport system substrate-binding protein